MRTICLLLGAGLGSFTALLFAQTIRVDGSSAGHTIVQIAAQEFTQKKKDSAVSVGLSGSAGGFKKFCRGEAEVVNAARPISKEEMALCLQRQVQFIELPVAFDAITVVVNPANTFVRNLSQDDLKRIWQASAQGKVVRWNQVNARFPDAPLKLLAPDGQSEQTSTFFEAVLGGARARGDYMGSVDEGVLVQGVAKDVNALSYVSYATFIEFRKTLKPVPIGSDGRAVLPSSESVAAGHYPLLARPLFVYVSVRSLGKPAVREFADFMLTDGSRIAKEARYVPLAESTYALGRSHLKSLKNGTAWGGVIPVGLTPDQLEKRQAAL